MTSDNVFARFNINTSDISVDTVLRMHDVYHEILSSLTNSKEENGDLATRRNKVKAEWLANFDLPSDVHNVIDETEALIFDTCLDTNGQVEALAAAYERVLAIASELKKHMDDRINRVANPNTRRQIVGTKAEAKQLRDVAQSLANVYATIQMMNESLPPMPNLEWDKIPPGRDTSLSDTPYVGGTMLYSLTVDHDRPVVWLTKTQFLDQLNSTLGKRMTRHEFDTYLDENNLPKHSDWTHTLEGVTFTQRRFDN